MINLIGIAGNIGSGKDTVAKIILQLLFKGADIESLSKNWEPHQYENLKSATGWEVKKFAYKLKQIASILTGIDIEKFEDQEFKERLMEKEWNRNLKDDKRGKVFATPNYRWFLQHLGTEAIRNNIHENAWVNALFADYQLTKKEGGFSRVIKSLEGIPYDYEYEVEYPKWIITDTRFPNEAQAIKQRKGIIIRVNRWKTGEPVGDKFTSDDGLQSAQMVMIDWSSKHSSETALNNWNFDWEIDNDDSLEILVRKVKEMLLHFNILKKETVNEK